MVYERPHGAGSIDASENGVEAVVQLGILEMLVLVTCNVRVGEYVGNDRLRNRVGHEVLGNRP